MLDKIYDVGIIGTGVAGMTAAIYCARANKSVLIFDKEGFGGKIAKSPKVENIPGFKSISGPKYAEALYAQMISYQNIEHEIKEIVLLNYNHGIIVLNSEDRDVYYCKSLIIASGTVPKELKLATADIYYCVSCDGPFFKNKNVIVVGSGNTGATFAIELASYCKKVYICDVTKSLCCEPILQESILNNSKIIWLPNTSICGVSNNENKLTSVNLSDNTTIKVSGIFAATGMEPQNSFAKSFVTLNDQGYIVANSEDLDTKVPGVFVAGDCREKKVKQVTTAQSDGTIAAIQAVKFVNTLK